MRNFSFNHYALGISTAALLLVSCGEPLVGASGTVPAAMGTKLFTNLRHSDEGPFLYVAGSKLSMYELGSTMPLHSTRTPYVSQAHVALDSHGDLCEANGNPSYPAIYAFNASTLHLKRTHGGAGYGDLAANRSGYLYEASGGSYLLVFAPGCTHYHNDMKGCICLGLVFDQSGNLYAGSGSVRVYAPTDKAWRMKFVREIHDGINGAGALAITPSGELFVSNNNSRSIISVFEPGSSEPTRRITKGLDRPGQLAVDSKGRLYVANRPLAPAPSSVLVYAPGGTRPIRRITASYFNPTALALDASDNLYVASANGVEGSYVAVYSPGGAKLLEKITDGIDMPTSLLIGSP
jgi:sugar lactone lactonase YvrE